MPRCAGRWWIMGCCSASPAAASIGAPRSFRLLEVVDPVANGPVAAALDTVQVAAAVVKLRAAASRAAEELARGGQRALAAGGGAGGDAGRELRDLAAGLQGPVERHQQAGGQGALQQPEAK